MTDVLCHQVGLCQGQGCASCSLALWTCIWLGKKVMVFVCDSSYPVMDNLSFQYESHWSQHCMMPISCFILLVVKNKAGLLPHLPCTSYLALDDINGDHSFSHNQRKTKPTFKVHVTPPALSALVCSCCQLLFCQSSGFKLTYLPDTGRLPFGYIHWIWLEIYLPLGLFCCSK